MEREDSPTHRPARSRVPPCVRWRKRPAALRRSWRPSRPRTVRGPKASPGARPAVAKVAARAGKTTKAGAKTAVANGRPNKWGWSGATRATEVRVVARKASAVAGPPAARVVARKAQALAARPAAVRAAARRLRQWASSAATRVEKAQGVAARPAGARVATHKAPRAPARAVVHKARWAGVRQAAERVAKQERRHSRKAPLRP